MQLMDWVVGLSVRWVSGVAGWMDGVIEWVWRICMDPMGTERWALFVKWVWKEKRVDE